MRPISHNAGWKNVLYALCKKKLVCGSFIILLCYTLIALLVKMNVIAHNWNDEIGGSHEMPNWGNWFGTDLLGRSVIAKIMQGCEIAMSVGLIVSFVSITLGIILGVVAGYFGGIIDACIVWLYTVIAAIPEVMLLMVIAFILGKGLFAVCMALSMVSWTDTCRLIRGEVMRHKSRDYIQAAAAIGASTPRILFIHMLPNFFSLIIVRVSVVFQSAIKSEVILSYLGLGIQGRPSWGIMINDARTEIIRGVWWELVFAIVALFILVLIFNIISDTLRDALDPKLKGK